LYTLYRVNNYANSMFEYLIKHKSIAFFPFIREAVLSVVYFSREIRTAFSVLLEN
jgi:hypothetical protein